MYKGNAFKSLKNSYFILLSIIFIVSNCIVSNCTNHKENVTISFAKSEQVFAADLTIQIDLGDLDSDGDLDAVYANHSNNYSKILLNDGNGYFTDSGQKLTQHGHGVGVGDLDSDGDLDIFITCAGARNEKGVFQNKPSKIYFNNRNGYNGNFLDFDLKLEEETCAVGDMDGDGDKDIIGKNSVWFNQLK